MALVILLLSICLWIFYSWTGLNRQFPLDLGMELWPYTLVIPGLGLGIRLFNQNLRKRWVLLSLSALIMILSASPVMDWLGIPSLHTPSDGLRVMSYNIWAENTDYEKIQKSVQQENPDILFLTELSDNATKELRNRLDYPYVGVSPLGSNVFFSRYPLLSVYPDYPHVTDHGKNFSLIAHVQTEQDVITVIGLHPPIPLSPSSFAVRNQQYERLAPYLHNLEGHVIVMGDFNMSPWSSYFQTFEQLSNLTSATRGHWIVATWSYRAGLPFLFAKLPIDHIEIRGFESQGAWAGRANGSDHRPIIAVLKASDDKI